MLDSILDEFWQPVYSIGRYPFRNADCYERFPGLGGFNSCGARRRGTLRSGRNHLIRFGFLIRLHTSKTNGLREMIFLLGWAAQTIGAYFIPLALSIVLSGWISGPESVRAELLNDALVAAVGLSLGLTICFLVPCSHRSGQWVWVAPTVWLMFVFSWEMSRGNFNALTVAFGTGEDGWGQFFITAPLLACISYSVVMRVRLSWHSTARARPVE
jgi:hypothetical protein